MDRAVLELVNEAKRVAEYLERPGDSWKPNTFRFSPELRNLAPGLRSAAEAVEQAKADIVNISPKPGEAIRDFIRNSRGEVVGVQCLVVRDGQTCGDLIPSIHGFKIHYTRVHGGEQQDCLTSNPLFAEAK